jgi:hypothetical protein
MVPRQQRDSTLLDKPRVKRARSLPPILILRRGRIEPLRPMRAVGRDDLGFNKSQTGTWPLGRESGAMLHLVNQLEARVGKT